MDATTIYALCEPDTGEIRYIGKTMHSAAVRLVKHMEAARREGHTHLYRWLLSLEASPIIKELASVPHTCGSEAEIMMIAQHRLSGARLVNATNGGDGTLGVTPSLETRAKMRAAHLGRSFSPETLAKMSAAKLGKSLPAEHVARMSASRRGKRRLPFSAETIAKIRSWNIGRKMPPISEETRQRMREAQLGKKHTAEHCAKISRGGMGRTPTAETRAKLSAAWARKRAAA
jgi:hypothetical protein